MTAIILSGGKATRLDGADKAFIKIKSIPLIKRQLCMLRKIFKQVIVVTNSPEKYRRLKGVKVIQDNIPDKGPLGGIYSGLLASRSYYNFIVASDMPFLNSGLIKYMCRNTFGYDAVVPKIKDRYEPLFSIYSKDCLICIKDSLHRKNFKISNFFSKVKVKAISEEEVLRFGLPQAIFTNINTRQDLKRLSCE